LDILHIFYEKNSYYTISNLNHEKDIAMSDLNHEKDIALDKIKEILKIEHKAHYDEIKFDSDWKNVMDSQIDLLTMMQKLQPLVNESAKRKLSYEENCEYAILMNKYIKMGFDPAYFTSGAGAPGNCTVC
jgi:hypothetical protein